MRSCRLTIVSLSVLSLIFPHYAVASEKEAAKVISSTVDDICKTVPLQGTINKVEVGGRINAAMKGFIAKLANLGFYGAAKYATSDYKGILQPDIPTIWKDNTNCRIAVTKYLTEFIMEAKEQAVTQKNGNLKFTKELIKISKILNHSPAMNQSGSVFSYGQEGGISGQTITINNIYQSSQESGVDHKEGKSTSATKKQAELDFNVGVTFYYGFDVKKDYKIAADFFLKAAENGSPGAENNLGVMYETGEGATKDISKAVKFYLSGAEHGSYDAQNNLGVLYFNGTGVAKDRSKSAYYFQKSATEGNSQAQLNLGLLYLEGEGVKQAH